MNLTNSPQDVQGCSASQSKQKGVFPIVNIESLSGGKSVYVGPHPGIVADKYIMKRFAEDITKFANNSTTKPESNGQLSVHGHSLSKSSLTTIMSSEEKKNEKVSKTICLEGCRYDVVRRIALELGFQEVAENDFWNILWTDSPVPIDKAHDMRRLQQESKSFWGRTMTGQKTNHFPGMQEICRKDRLARNLNRMRKAFPDDYQFYPKTWTLPADIPELLAQFRANKHQTIICKPDSGCQGKGIFLVRNLKKMNPFAKLIAQVYIPNPLLIDGYKFDLRIYILITSCDPLRMYVYNEGIARFATVKYSKPNDQNVDVVFMHLTNYSLNKFSQSYVPEPEGSKRKMSTVYGYLVERGFNVEKMIEDIDDVIIKTVIAAQPTLRHYYHASFPRSDKSGSSCFELLGFDILIDDTLKPWLIEVNLSPSFNLDLEVDAEIKESLLRDTLHKIYLGVVRERGASTRSSKKKGVVNQTPPAAGDIMDKAGNNIPKMFQKQFYHEQSNQGNFRLIYPTDNCYKYAEFLDPSLNLASFADISNIVSRRGTASDRYKNEVEEASGTNTQPSNATNSTPRPAHGKAKQKKQSAKAANPEDTNSEKVSEKKHPEQLKELPSTTIKPESPNAQSKTTRKKENDDPDVQDPVKLAIELTRKKSKKKKAVTEKTEVEGDPVVTRMMDKRGSTILVNALDGLSPVNHKDFHCTQRVVSQAGGEPSKEIDRYKNVSPRKTVSSAVTLSLAPLPLIKPDVRLLMNLQNDPLKYVPTQANLKIFGDIQASLDSTVEGSGSSGRMSKNKLIEEWLSNGVNKPMSSRPQLQGSFLPSVQETKAGKNSKRAGATSVRKARKAKGNVNLPSPVLEREETERKGLLKEREKVIREMGIEGAMMRTSGTLSVEEEVIYNKIFSEEEFLANKSGKSTLLNTTVQGSKQSLTASGYE